MLSKFFVSCSNVILFDWNLLMNAAGRFFLAPIFFFVEGILFHDSITENSQLELSNSFLDSQMTEMFSFKRQLLRQHSARMQPWPISVWDAIDVSLVSVST